jgi:two-component system alkaline phosphatase synthesis response regulator PhoP
MATKILLAEDDIQLVDMYNRKFELEGFDVKTAEDGEAALKILENFKPDVILLDIMMPKITGLEVLAELKKKPEYEDTLIIMLTNLADEKTAKKIYQLGATDYFVKAEMTPLEVSTKVKELLKYYKKA